MAELTTLTLGGRTFAPVEGTALTFRQHTYAMAHVRAARLHEDAPDAETFLVRVLESGSASHLLAAALVEQEAGRALPWSPAWADATAAFFDGLTGVDTVQALTDALTAVLIPFYLASVRSSTTSPSASAATTDAIPAPTAAPSISATGRPSSDASPRPPRRSRRSSTGPSATG